MTMFFQVFKNKKVSKPKGVCAYLLIPRMRKCIDSALLKKSGELLLAAKGHSPRCQHPLRSEKVTWTWQNRGYFLPVFVLSVYVTCWVRSVLNFDLTHGVLGSVCIIPAIISALPKFLFGTKLLVWKEKKKNYIKRVSLLSLVCGPYLTTKVVYLKIRRQCVLLLFICIFLGPAGTIIFTE